MRDALRSALTAARLQGSREGTAEAVRVAGARHERVRVTALPHPVGSWEWRRERLRVAIGEMDDRGETT